MKIKTFCLVLLALAAPFQSTLQARIGETLSQCTERYGEPVANWDASQYGTWYRFLREPYQINVLINPDGYCWAIDYGYPPRTSDLTYASGTVLSDEEIDALLKIENPIGWRSVGFRCWRSDDRKMIASYYLDTRAEGPMCWNLHFMSQEAFDFTEKVKTQRNLEAHRGL